jgi:hypothetical protein
MWRLLPVIEPGMGMILQDKGIFAAFCCFGQPPGLSNVVVEIYYVLYVYD